MFWKLSLQNGSALLWCLSRDVARTVISGAPDIQGPVVRSMVSADHWLRSIEINRLSWYLTLVSANQASSNSAQMVFVVFEMAQLCVFFWHSVVVPVAGLCP